MAEKEPIRFSLLPSATATEDGYYLAMDTGSATYKIKISDFMATFLNDISTKISDEQTKRIQADTEISELLNAEKVTREKQDTTLQSNINTEKSARISADDVLTSLIQAVKTASETADTTLQTNIDTEEANRKLADSSIEYSINKHKKIFSMEDCTKSNLTYTYRHNLHTKDFLINVYSDTDLYPTIERVNTDTVRLTFDTEPADFNVVMVSVNELALQGLAVKLPINGLL